MNLTATQIEDIVRVVVQRLRAGVAAPPVHATPEFHQLPNIQSAAGEIQVSDRVVTLASLKDILVDAKAIVVHPKAVVTPAVIDELRKRNIRLVRQLPTPSAQSKRPVPLLLVTTQELLPALCRRICSQQATTISAQNDAASTASQIEQNLSDGNFGAIWCSTTPFASVAATYGHARLRAMQLTDLRDLPRAIDQAQPNLLILDCHTWTAPAIANLVRNWYRSLR